MKNQRKIGVVLSYLNIGIEFVIGLAYTPIMLRLLGQSEYGVYNAASSVISYLGLLTLGFGSAYMRFYARYKAKDDRDGIAKLNGLFAMVFGAAAVLAVLAGSVLTSMPQVVFGGKFTPHELAVSQKLLALMTVNTGISFTSTVFSMYITAHERFVYSRVLGIISTLTGPLVTFPLLLMGYGSVAMAAVHTAVQFCVLICNIAFTKKLGMRFRFGKPDFHLLKEISVFSVFIFLTSLSSTINGTIDKLLLGRHIGSESVAVYEVGHKFDHYLMIFSVNVSAVFIPKINMMVAERDDNRELTDLMIRVGRIQFLILGLIFFGFALVGRYFISIYAGAGYEDSYTIALMVMAGAFVPYIQNIGIEIQKAKNKHAFRSIAYLLIAFCNIGVSIPLIRTFGIKGAAVGTALSLLVGNTIIMNIYYKKGIQLEMGRFWKSMLKPIAAAVISFAPCFALSLFWQIDSLLRFGIMVVLFVVLYIAAQWIVGMNNEEKDMVRSFLKRLKKSR